MESKIDTVQIVQSNQVLNPMVGLGINRAMVQVLILCFPLGLSDLFECI